MVIIPSFDLQLPGGVAGRTSTPRPNIYTKTNHKCAFDDWKSLLEVSSGFGILIGVLVQCNRELNGAS